MQPLWKSAWSFLKNLKIELPYDLAIPLLSIHSTAALFIVGKKLNQSWCSRSNEWIKKTWYIYTLEDYLAIKNEIILLIGKWMKLEIMLNEIRQTEKDKIPQVSLTCGI
jgi:hypothetical protein